MTTELQTTEIELDVFNFRRYFYHNGFKVYDKVKGLLTSDQWSLITEVNGDFSVVGLQKEDSDITLRRYTAGEYIYNEELQRHSVNSQMGKDLYMKLKERGIN